MLRILRPAESAVRRLIVVAARHLERPDLTATTRTLPDFSTFAATRTTGRAPVFQLIDPRKKFGIMQEDAPADWWVEEERASKLSPVIPRISVPGVTTQFSPPEKPAPEPNAETILRRVVALEHALNTLPRQARRLKRLMARRQQALPGKVGTGFPSGNATTRLQALPGKVGTGFPSGNATKQSFNCVGPVRPGLPPGYRRHHPHAVDAILIECHDLVRDRDVPEP